MAHRDLSCMDYLLQMYHRASSCSAFLAWSLRSGHDMYHRKGKICMKKCGVNRMLWTGSKGTISNAP